MKNNETIDLRCRYIQDDEDNYSFQLYDQNTNVIIFTSPLWFRKKSEAQLVANELLQQYHTQYGENMDAMGNSNKKILHSTCIMAISKTTGKYGYAICDEDEKILIRPTQWFDTTQEAFEAANDDLKKSMIKLRKLAINKGFSAVALDAPKLDDFQLEGMAATEPNMVSAEPISKLPSSSKMPPIKKLFSIDELCTMFQLNGDKILNPKDPTKL